MFSDSWFGELGRAITDEFNLVVTRLQIVEPSVGGFMIFGGGALLVDNSNSLMWIFWSGFISVFGCGGNGFGSISAAAVHVSGGADGETAMA